MWRSASKSAAATPRLARSVGQPERGRGILEAAVSLVQEQDVANALRSDHGRGQIEVELAVAVGVEGGDGRAEAGADPADHRQRAGEVGRLDPPLAFGKLDLQRPGSLEIRRDRRGARRPARGAETG